MALYTYRFSDLLTDRDVAELEVTNATFDRRIIVPGSFRGVVNVSNPEVGRAVRNVVPGRTVCHVYRDQEIWGSYIIWTMRVSSPQRGPVVVELNGASLESWLYRRLLDKNVQYNQLDQITIARNLITIAQTGWSPYSSSANLGIELQTGSSGVLRDREYRIDEAATVGQRLEELANVDNGFEYMIHTYYDPASDSRRRLFKWGYPLLGNSSNVWSFQQPGNVLSFELSYDANEGATAFWTRGDSIEDDLTNESIPIMTASPTFANEYMNSGFPHIDKVIDYSGVTSLLTLEQYAQWWRDNRGGIVLIPQIEVRASDDDYQIMSPARVGEYANIVIENVFFPLNADGSPSYSDNLRIVGIEVTASQRNEIEKHKLVVSQDFDPTGI